MQNLLIFNNIIGPTLTREECIGHYSLYEDYPTISEQGYATDRTGTIPVAQKKRRKKGGSKGEGAPDFRKNLIK